MKISLLVLFLLCNLLTLCQVESVYKIDSLPPGGLTLDKGWKWQTGDEPGFAKPDFDDSKWESIDPSKDISDLPQLATPGVIFWLRLHFTFTHPPLKALGVMIRQSGASEVYLDGQPVEKYGSVKGQVVAINPKDLPVNLPLNSSPIHVMAVRYVLQPQINYTRLYGNSNELFRIQLNSLKKAINLDRAHDLRYTNLETYKLGLFFILFVLNISFFLFNYKQKVHLLVAGVFLFSGLEYAAKLIADVSIYVKETHLLYSFSYLFSNIIPLLLLASLYSFMQIKRGAIIWGLVAFTILKVVGVLFSQANIFNYVSFILSVLLATESFRVLIYGIKTKKRGAWILTIGIAVNVFFFVFLFAFLDYFIAVSSTLDDIIFNIALIAYPVSLSIYMAIDSAYTNKELKQKIDENTKLAGEKEAILKDQNILLEKQVNERTNELLNSLTDLKSAQSQLIHSEKMASLGELTAGIAHEIQNPLNFVNNFSDVNKELLEELKEEVDKGNMDEVKAIANDVIGNEEKINHHGKRADSIVKGMLQHSRSSTGVKEPADINALADEYLRLSYHGLRAKDKSFNADFKTDFDNSIGKINIVPQDIGRVLLNLINNAFYAVNERQKITKENLPTGQAGYQPIIFLSSKKSDDKVILTVKDNGNGISQNIVDKIFQPFFTTKPTGQGTGLGLSLSYDIIKAHGGEIKVQSEEGTGATFTIEFPIT
jgi:two-component system NtrC family sensor kinase